MADRNLQLIVEYDGTPYAGWQRQAGVETVQGTLEDRFSRIAGHRVELLVAGRTDAGVHALGQTANFHTRSALPLRRIHQVVNQLLPHGIRVVRMKEVPAAFHATYHADSKLYRYVIRNRADYTVFDRHYYHHVRRPLDTAAMAKAARFLEGTHDFTAFRGTLGKWADPERTLRRVRVRRKGDDILLDYWGLSFLHQMVRIMSGTLLYVGLGKFAPEDLKGILKSKDRKKAGPTLPPEGLFLVKVFYPRTFPPVRKKKKKEED